MYKKNNNCCSLYEYWPPTGRRAGWIHQRHCALGILRNVTSSLCVYLVMLDVWNWCVQIFITMTVITVMVILTLEEAVPDFSIHSFCWLKQAHWSGWTTWEACVTWHGHWCSAAVWWERTAQLLIQTKLKQPSRLCIVCRHWMRIYCVHEKM